VNELLARARAVFLAPPSITVVPPRRAAVAPPDLVAVLAAPRDLAAVAGGVAGGLRRRHRARAALVCAPGVAAATGGPATRAARTLCSRLAARELVASAAGPLCRVVLPDSPEEAVRDAWRAIAAAAGYPAVVALPAREAAHDALLVHADLLLLAAGADADATYAELALASLAALGPPAGLTRPPAGVLSRRLAALGLTTVTFEAEGALA